MSGTTIPPLPAGFVLDEQSKSGLLPAQPPPPPGFVLDTVNEQPGWLATIGSVAQQVAKGMTFNFGDEIMSGVKAAAGTVTGAPGMIGERYDRSLKEFRARDKAFEEANPVLSTALQVGGAIANPLARKAVGGGIVRRTLGNAGVGAGLGVLAGFGEGEGDAATRAGTAIKWGTVGGLAGGAIPLVATVAGKAGSKAADVLGLTNNKAQAQRQLIDALKADTQAGGDDLNTLAARLQGAPPDQPMILPDVALPGGDVAGLAQAVSREPGPGRAVAAAAVNERGGLNQSKRLTDAVKRGISAEDFLGAERDLIESRARNAGPAYEKALAIPDPVNVQPIVDDINARLGSAKGDIKIALQKALGVFRDRSGKIDTSMAGLHETKLAMDALLERTPQNSISRVARRELMGIQERLLAAMDEASGGTYAQAREAFAGPSRALDAMELGKRILKGDADETAAEIAKLSPSERDFLRIGVARALVDRVKSGGDTADISKLKSIWGSEAVRERVAAAFDDPKAFDEFSDFMKREMDMARVNAQINPAVNSPTAAILSRRNAPSPAGPALSALVSAVRGDALGAGTNALRASGALQPGVTLRAEELAPYLFTMKAGDRARLIDELISRETTDAGRERIGRLLGGALLKGGTVGSVQSQD